jgi:hypothetical protein
MGNPYKGRPPVQTGQVADMIPHVSGSDTTLDSGDVGIGMYVTVAGNVKFLSAAGVERTVAAAANSYIICGVSKVIDSGTTATGVHILVT